MKLLTKGDNNSVDDRGLYAPGQLWIRRNEVVGRARGLVDIIIYSYTHTLSVVANKCSFILIVVSFSRCMDVVPPYCLMLT